MISPMALSTPFEWQRFSISRFNKITPTRNRTIFEIDLRLTLLLLNNSPSIEGERDTDGFTCSRCCWTKLIADKEANGPENKSPEMVSKAIYRNISNDLKVETENSTSKSVQHCITRWWTKSRAIAPCRSSKPICNSAAFRLFSYFSAPFIWCPRLSAFYVSEN